MWSNTARHDVARIFDFNVGFSGDRALAIDRRLVEAGDLIERNPFVGRVVVGSSVRERSLPDIQYVIRYRIGADGKITILAIRHTRENRDLP